MVQFNSEAWHPGCTERCLSEEVAELYRVEFKVVSHAVWTGETGRISESQVCAAHLEGDELKASLGYKRS